MCCSTRQSHVVTPAQTHNSMGHTGYIYLPARSVLLSRACHCYTLTSICVMARHSALSAERDDCFLAAEDRRSPSRASNNFRADSKGPNNSIEVSISSSARAYQNVLQPYGTCLKIISSGSQTASHVRMGTQQDSKLHNFRHRH